MNINRRMNAVNKYNTESKNKIVDEKTCEAVELFKPMLCTKLNSFKIQICNIFDNIDSYATGISDPKVDVKKLKKKLNAFVKDNVSDILKELVKED